MKIKKKRRLVQRGIDLSAQFKTQETSSTIQEDSTEKSISTKYSETVKVPPPFRGEGSGTFVSWGQLAIIWKVLVWLIPLLVSAIWYAAVIYTRVDSLQQDTKDIKETLQKLAERTINQDSRINLLEKTVKEDSKTKEFYQEHPAENAPQHKK